MAAAPNGCIRQDWPTLEIVNTKRKGKVGRPRTMWEILCNKIFAQAYGCLSFKAIFSDDNTPLEQSHRAPPISLRPDDQSWTGWLTGGQRLRIRKLLLSLSTLCGVFGDSGGLKKSSTSFFGADAWRKGSWEGVVAWVLDGVDGADDRGGTLKVYACSAFMVEAIAVLKAYEWAWNRGWRSVEVFTDCLQLVVLVLC
ncbi:hypothetical protein RHSIM_RhsimUnG0175300 [Rhododendron simsii]|uniref:RNase H type-1 domain-containing protein n=1 Tax=Rhododendron simsii TaxID=118357 RepID=A0A834FUM2_RHOSS|nr:hypothetical protein RHSIM_RhsimUnG0175300 [Rhododendron simsii]